MTRPTRKFAISDFKGVVGKVAQELISNQNGIDISNFDFRHVGSLNLRPGIQDCLSGIGAVKGMRRFYGSGSSRSLLVADTKDFFNVNTAMCTKEKINIFQEGVADVTNGSPTVTIDHGASQDTGFVLPNNTGTPINVTNVSNILTEDGNDAIFRDDDAFATAQTFVSDFDFDSLIPDVPSVVINGIEIEYKGKNANGTAYTSEQLLIRRDTATVPLFVPAIGPAEPLTSYALGTTEAVVTIGGASELFGESWDRDDFLDGGGFGLQLQLVAPTGNGQEMELDYIKVKVYYTTGSADTGLLQNVKIGDTFVGGDSSTIFNIDVVTANTITLDSNFNGTTDTGVDYTIFITKSNPDKIDSVLVQSKNRVYIANGVDQPMEWDGGTQLNDIGLTAPDPLVGVDGIAGSIPDGTYQYLVVFISEFGESNGSTSISVVVSGGPSQVDLTSIDIGPNKVTARDIYRTVAGGNDFFFLTRLSDNSTTTFTDNVLDASLTQVLADPQNNNKPPVLRYIEWHKNKLFGVAPNSNSIRFSEDDFPDHWPAFNEFKTLNGENVERLASLGDLLVVFTRNSVQILLGDNKDNFVLKGIENGFGLVAPFSVAKGPSNSLFYLSQTGIRQFAGRQSPRISDPTERLLYDPKSKHRINKTQYSKVCSIHTDNKLYTLYPRKSNTNNDAIIVFDFMTNDWYILDIPASSIESFDGGGDQNELFIGNADGEIKQIETGEDDNGNDIVAKYTTRYINMGSHEEKYFVNIYLKVFATGVADVKLIASTESRPGTIQKPFLNLRDISRGQELLWNLPNDMRGEGIQIRIEVKGSNRVRIERMVIEHSIQPEADNSKSD